MPSGSSGSSRVIRGRQGSSRVVRGRQGSPGVVTGRQGSVILLAPWCSSCSRSPESAGLAGKDGPTDLARGGVVGVVRGCYCSCSFFSCLLIWLNSCRQRIA